MDRYALIDNQGVVDNIILWDGIEYHEELAPTSWMVPEGFDPVRLDDGSLVGIGDTIDSHGNVLVKYQEPEPEPDV